MIIGGTGHQDIPETALGYVTTTLSKYLATIRQLEGVCSLAAGADQLFAETILNEGGQLRVVVPCAGYESTFDGGETRDSYQSLLQKAVSVTQLDYAKPSEDAFSAAGQHIVNICDQLVAVWDGKQARGHGGTADIVMYARKRGKNIMVIWPEGVVRP